MTKPNLQVATSNAIKIVKGEKLPDFSIHGNKKYPWHEMEVGDYFATPIDKNAHMLANVASKRLSPKIFKARKRGADCRVWRIA